MSYKRVPSPTLPWDAATDRYITPAEVCWEREDAMRPIIKATLCALAAAAVAVPAFAASADYYLKLGDVKGGAAAKAGAGKQLEILSWSWGEAGSWDGTIKGAASAGKYGAVGGMHRDDSVAGDARADAAVTAPRDAAGMPTEKRQHGWVTVSKALDRGAVRVKVKFPWLDCKVGAAFPDAVLQNDAGRYEFENVLISGCAADSVTLDYAKVRVRGWDPEKKE
jgi:hypothetical protein